MTTKPTTSEKAGRFTSANTSASARFSGARVRSSGPEQSINRILDATLETLSRQGLHSLSMTDVCRAAGVARGTLYRYFPTKEALLEGIGEQVRIKFEDGLASVIADDQGGKERFESVIGFLVEYSGQTRGERLLEVEPGFVLDFLARNLPHYAEIMAEALAPFFEEIETRTGSKVDGVIWAELILRTNLSFFLIPSAEGGADLLEELRHVLEFLTRSPQGLK